jgi:hypothetical protein
MGITRRRLLPLLSIVAVLSTAQTASAQWMSIVPNAQFGHYPTKFLEACMNLSAWPNVLSVTDHLGSFNGDLDAAASQDPSTLAMCFSNMRAAGLKLSIEAAAFQPGGCGLGSECYGPTAQTLNSVIALGMPSDSIMIRMDEPYDKGVKAGWYIGDTAYQTASYMQLLRDNYPGISITDIEPYPINSLNSLYAWQLTLHSQGVALDEFEVDHDRNECGGTCWSWSDVASLLSNTHAWGWKFGYIFGSPVPPGGYWTQSALDMGYAMHTNGIVPDHYTFESWETNGDPVSMLPQSDNFSFIGGIRYFRDLGFFPR